MTRVAFTLLGEPRGMPRHRTLRNGRAYTPKWAKLYQRAICATFRQHFFGPIPDVPTRVEIHAVFAAPKRKPTWFTGPVAHYRSAVGYEELRHGNVPDADNVAKMVLDAIWPKRGGVPDSRVYNLHVTKFYGRPRLEVVVTFHDGH